MSEEQSNSQQNQKHKKQSDNETIEKDILSDLAFEALKESKRSRRWKLMSRLISLLIVAIIAWLVLTGGQGMQTYKSHAAVVNIDGVIADQYPANAEDITQSLREAFANKYAKGVLIKINSPGGSVVQSDNIYQAIRALKQEHPKVPVYTVCTDVCASGGYYVAAATDGIYANRSSIVGSIGVLSGGFGFVEAIHKLGIERRLFTAGNNKDFMDPFSKLQEKDVKHLKGMLNDIHNQFINVVKQGRGNKLAKNNDQLFSGAAWTGEQAKTLGLVDGFGTLHEVARDKLDTKTLADYSQQSMTPWGLMRSLRSSLISMLYSPGFQFLMTGQS